MRSFLHGDDGAGNGGVYRRAKARAVADLLPDGHTLADGNQRFARRTDVLRHRNTDEFRLKNRQRCVAR